MRQPSDGQIAARKKLYRLHIARLIAVSLPFICLIVMCLILAGLCYENVRQCT